ncbi:MAG: hypothetical protein HY721_08860 [Planctomycetes bacterium]|nr:hypothetical protein [Planctomycetota bacterium]
MSEYQYYELQALDRPLTESEMRELRAVSTRATITPTRFVNVYHFGDFKGRPRELVERYFDAFLYLANWGTRWLMLRFPRRALGLETARRYCAGKPAEARECGDRVILELLSELDGGDWEESGPGLLSSLVPLRSDIASGDHRALYLAWLLCAQQGDLEEEAPEPPCPPGLGTLTEPLRELADFLRIPDEWIQAAASRSPPLEEAPPRAALEAWVTALPEAEKTALLVRAANEDGDGLRAELLRRFREAHKDTRTEEAALPAPRTVRELREAAEDIARERRRREAELAAEEQARRERVAAEVREKSLAGVAAREPEAWRQVETLIMTKRPAEYDQAVQLLRDLSEVGRRAGRGAEVDDRLRALRDRHAKKHTLLERLDRAGLGVSVDVPCQPKA